MYAMDEKGLVTRRMKFLKDLSAAPREAFADGIHSCTGRETPKGRRNGENTARNGLCCYDYGQQWQIGQIVKMIWGKGGVLRIIERLWHLVCDLEIKGSKDENSLKKTNHT